MDEPTTLQLLLAYAEVFVTLFAAAGNSLLGIIVTIIGVFLTIFQDSGTGL